MIDNLQKYYPHLFHNLKEVVQIIATKRSSNYKRNYNYL